MRHFRGECSCGDWARTSDELIERAWREIGLLPEIGGVPMHELPGATAGSVAGAWAVHSRNSGDRAKHTLTLVEVFPS